MTGDAICMTFSAMLPCGCAGEGCNVPRLRPIHPKPGPRGRARAAELGRGSLRRECPAAAPHGRQPGPLRAPGTPLVPRSARPCPGPAPAVDAPLRDQHRRRVGSVLQRTGREMRISLSQRLRRDGSGRPHEGPPRDRGIRPWTRRHASYFSGPTAAFWLSAERVQSAKSGRKRSLPEAVSEAVWVYGIALGREVPLDTIISAASNQDTSGAKPVAGWLPAFRATPS